MSSYPKKAQTQTQVRVRKEKGRESENGKKAKRDKFKPVSQ